MNTKEQIIKEQNKIGDRLKRLQHEAGFVEYLLKDYLPLSVIVRIMTIQIQRLKLFRNLLDKFTALDEQLEKLGNIPSLNAQLEEIQTKKLWYDWASEKIEDYSKELRQTGCTPKEFAKYIAKVVKEDGTDKSNAIDKVGILFGEEIASLIAQELNRED